MMKRLWILFLSAILCVGMLGCTVVKSSDAKVKKLPGYSAFLAEMKEIDPNYELRVSFSEPEYMNIRVTGDLEQAGTVEELLHKTVEYLFDPEVFTALNKYDSVCMVPMNGSVLDYSVELRLSPKKGGYYYRGSSYRPEGTPDVGEGLYLSGYDRWSLSVRELGNIKNFSSDTYIFSQEGGILHEETGEALDFWVHRDAVLENME